MAAKELYFLALMPPYGLATKIHHIKEEISEKYKCSYSLKIPEHITIIPPFHCNEDEVRQVCDFVRKFAAALPAFEVELKNFGHFSNRVLFIPSTSKPENLLPELYYSTKRLFEDELSFLKKIKLSNEYVPHLTIANRDLNPFQFKQAWEEFGGRTFEESFEANSLFLLQLENGLWNPFEKFEFTSTNNE